MARPTVSQIDDIRQQMATLRLGLHQDAVNVVGEAADAFDWKSILARRPWLTVGAAVVVGYLAIPRKRRPVPVTLPPGEVQAIAAAVEEPRRPESTERKSSGVGGAIWSLAKFAFSIGGPFALQAAQSYALAWLESSLAQTQGGSRGSPPSPPPPSSRPDLAAPRRR